ncbi:PREDICTED: prefoldin subunit 3 isoform X2 [Rhagoletis zephyria]|uniref:LOW QUALITY PROTEIN: prefoldin subunit 3 n=1 Tax=Rhagoletis pomonella TaxID=28610 RepID=UPI0008114511|nr:PREDICTED: prefoldin subunit 3 isoform X2 [Rhagoletis zephyria]XP_036342741.1 LOW QUALITY PROTEIN: prefoldin subunit 3 [Rhagoletis pomonella]
MTGIIDSVEMPKLPDNQKSFAGIPEAVFLEEIDTFMSQPENEDNCEKVLQRLDEQHSKYRFMAYNLEARRRKLKSQIPDLQRSLEMINVLRQEKEERETQFLLSDQVFIKTLVPPTKTVCLWLGASVMLEYPLDEAEELLKQNMNSAIINLKTVEHDQDFLRDQLTTTEVNMARVYNWGVKKRQAAAKTNVSTTS